MINSMCRSVRYSRSGLAPRVARSPGRPRFRVRAVTVDQRSIDIEQQGFEWQAAHA
jgi:hypothetical protein